MAVRASLGIALTEPSHTEVGELLRNADMAMYRAKGMGKGRYALYESGMHGEVTKRLALSAALTRAVEHGELSLVFQPVVDLVSGHVYGVEALARWSQPDGTVVSPDEFVPLAEETGLILPIGSWVLDAACEQLARWHRETAATRDLMVSVNVSARQLMEATFVDELRAVVSRHGVRPGNLVLELTESVLIDDVPGVTRTLEALKELGVRLAIDDFGTGYSSMNYVSRFPIDVLKIDQSFVEEVSENTTSTALVAAMVQLANSLGITAVAEGVEREEQAEALRRLGCRFGQGHLFARPVAAAEIDALLAAPPAAPVPSAQPR
jgi:EAL domain-containing protein (putative c-di-GMP-specific phosphodiesterase class I)